MDRREFLKSAFTAAALAPVAGLAAGAEAVTGGAAAGGPAALSPAGKVTRRRYKETDLTLPLLGFGMMRLPRIDPEKPDIDEPAAQRLVDRAMAAGVNYFDTAWPYHNGLSETFVGKALKKYPRDSYLIATKMWAHLLKTEADVPKMFEEQLKKLQTDHVDFYLIHALDKRLWPKAKELKVYEYLKKQKDAGRIKYLGFSFHDEPELLAEIVKEREWDFAQIQLNYVDWELYRSREQYEILTKAGIPVIVMEPLRGSSLASLTPKCLEMFKAADPDSTAASWAFRYAGSLPNVITVLSGMTLPEHLEDNIKTFTDFRPLSDTERETLAAVAKVYHNTGAVPCTNCKYCMPCPVGVEIPRIFGLYNSYKTSGDFRRRFGRIYAAFDPDTMASACVECGACLKKCPQHIDIPSQLKKIHAEYESRRSEMAYLWKNGTEFMA